jgi:hypothetical protein
VLKAVLLCGSLAGPALSASFWPARLDTHVGESITSVGVGDFDQNGVLDAAGVSYGGTIVVAEGLGTGRFRPILELVAAGNGPRRIAVADFDGDGELDLATSESTANASYLRGIGDGTFSPAVNVPTIYSSSEVAAADIVGGSPAMSPQSMVPPWPVAVQCRTRSPVQRY